jgi:hypothetical protein
MRAILSLCGLILGLTISAQDVMVIHKTGQIAEKALISVTDSVYFNEDGTVINFIVNGSLTSYALSVIDSITFGQSSDTVSVIYSGSSAIVDNPLAFDGVTVSISGADVKITSVSETKDIVYKLSGTTTDGSFKMYSDKRFDLVLAGLSLTNSSGPAINIQSDKNITVLIPPASVNFLADGSSYNDQVTGDDGNTENQDAAFYSEGKLVFTGSGKLTVTGNGAGKHALFSEETVEVTEGTILVNGAAADGLHGKKGVVVSGGSVSVNGSGDGIDGGSGNVLLSGGTLTLVTSGSSVLVSSGSGYDPSHCSAIRSDSIVTLDGAKVTITGTGKGNRGISSDGGIEILSGTLVINESGAGASYTNTSGAVDAYGANCLSSDGSISIAGGTITLTNSGSAGKGISSCTLTIGNEGGSPVVNITTTGSKITLSGNGQNAESAEAKAIKATGAVVIANGDLIISSADDGIKSAASVTISHANVELVKSVEGIEAPAITVNSGTVSIVASDDAFNATRGNGGESNDGSQLYLNGGNIQVNAPGGDGLDSNGSITMTGGTVVVHGPQSSPEVGMDYNGTCNVNGGLLVISGSNSNMTQAPSTTSSLYALKVTTNSALSASTLFHIRDASGNSIVTFQPARSYYSVVFSSSALSNGGSYSVYTGGTCSGTNSNGLYSGGTYTGGTMRKTFTVSGKVTNVSF